eukprot:TRINITY_DN8477_c0_g1_i2.p2 TRINITY_DN8477_c0_g1~~TRINITY_DN8477_c0_g1_i2.p2  ORF type:complete len:106 (-),score=1.19 TRINITY_DN8477_c0_g1_i2:113-430(-)
MLIGLHCRYFVQSANDLTSLGFLLKTKQTLPETCNGARNTPSTRSSRPQRSPGTSVQVAPRGQRSYRDDAAGRAPCRPSLSHLEWHAAAHPRRRRHCASAVEEVS